MRLEFGDMVYYNDAKYKIIGESVEGEFKLQHLDNGLTIEVDKQLVCYVCPNCEHIDAQV